MKLRGIGLSDRGRNRPHNEDHLSLESDLGLYLVCDGMGGLSYGDVASQNASNIVTAYIRERRAVIDKYEDTPDNRNRVIRLVNDAIQEASSSLYKLAVGTHGRAGMGTTLTLLLAIGSKGFMAHVGDTRLYLCRDGYLHQLSEDHNYLHELVKHGVLTSEEAASSPYAHAITRAVGIQESVRVDTLVFDVLPGDLFLLCSDGLTRYFTDPRELQELLTGNEQANLPKLLIDAANARGGRDNISSIIIHADANGDAKAADLAHQTEVNLRLETLRYISLFQHLTLRELCLVLNSFQSAGASRGDVVIREGDDGDALYVLLEGQLKVVKGNTHLAHLVAGTHFGEMALLRSRPRSASVIADEESRLLYMDREAFNALVRREPSLGVKLLWSFSQVLSWRLDDASEALYFADPNKKMIRHERSPFGS